MLLLLLLCFFFTFLYPVYWYLVVKRHPDNFPPGPRMTLPFIGDKLALGNAVEGSMKFQKKYGDIFGFWVGSKTRQVYVNNYELFQELGYKEEFSYRPGGHFTGFIGNRDLPGVIFSSGKNWSEQRRFALHTLRNLGFGKNSMESAITEEAIDLCDFLESKSGEAVNIRNMFNINVLNVLWNILAGEKLPRNDTKLHDILVLLDRAQQNTKGIGLPFLFSFWPLNKINDRYQLYPTFAMAYKQLVRFGFAELTKHESTYQEDSMRDFIDIYLKQIYDCSSKSETSTFKGKLGKMNLASTIADFFIGGGETTSLTINWCMLYMILHPDVQKRVQEELDSVTGRSRTPVIADRLETPYTEAVIHEVQRISSTVPHTVTHFAPNGGTFDNGKYYIPPETWIYGNMLGVHMNGKDFPNPEKFDPNRFINEEGKFIPHPKVIPFGLGKRRCLGEALAKMTVYLFFATILSTFTLIKDKDDNPSSNPIMGGVQSPKPFKMRFIKR